MSRAIGAGAAQFMGARVAGQPTYILPHVKNGKNINQRCIIPVYINSNKGTNRDGSPGRSDQFRLVAWGKLADITAKSLSKGKAIDCVCSPHSYEGRIYDAQGNMRVDNTGQPITVERVGFTIERIVFGEESQKEVDQEVATGRRPINWNNPQHPDYQTWLSILQTRQNTQYTGGDTFGFARVITPSGPGITLTTGQTPNSGFTPGATPTNATQGQSGAAGAAIDPNVLAQMVAQVLKGNAQVPQAPNTPPAQNDAFVQNATVPNTPVGGQGVF